MEKFQSDQGFQPVETSIGILYGRDAIFLDRLDVDINQDTLTLQGDFNGRLASKSKLWNQVRRPLGPWG